MLVTCCGVGMYQRRGLLLLLLLLLLRTLDNICVCRSFFFFFSCVVQTQTDTIRASVWLVMVGCVSVMCAVWYMRRHIHTHADIVMCTQCKYANCESDRETVTNVKERFLNGLAYFAFGGLWLLLLLFGQPEDCT